MMKTSTLSSGIKVFCAFFMVGSSILKLYDDEHHSDWTITLNYPKSFQYIIGIIELIISYLSISELL